VFYSVRSTVTAIAHTVCRKRLSPWYGKLTMF